MRSPSAADVIAMWEQAACQHPVDRALTLLARCSPEPREALAALSIGARDARLFALHELLFGPRFEGFAECPHCDERLEYAVDAANLLPAHGAEEPLEPLLVSDGVALRLRPLDSTDFAAAAACADADEARRLLASRCVVEAARDGIALSATQLPERTVERIATWLASADPQADVLIDIECPNCAHRWQAAFQIERFLWAKLNALAKRLLREVDVLARTYGWSEHEILSLSAMRRAVYLEMAS